MTQATDRERLAAELRDRLHYQRLHRRWAKFEILLGLSAAGVGLLVGDVAVSGGWASADWRQMAVGLGLFVLGWYLALAGHRSHLYQSANDQLALLVEEIRREPKVS